MKRDRKIAIALGLTLAAGLLQGETVALWKLGYDQTGTQLNTRCLVNPANNLEGNGAIAMTSAVDRWRELPPKPDGSSLLASPTNRNAVALSPNAAAPFTSLTSGTMATRLNITNSFTIEGWLNVKDNPVDTGWHYLCGAHLAGSGRWILSLRNGGTNWVIYVNSLIWDTPFPVKNDPAATNTWRHLALTYDHDGGLNGRGVWELFVDALSCGQLTNSAPITSLATSESIFALGGRPDRLNTGNIELDYWRVSDRVLQPVEFLNASEIISVRQSAGLLMMVGGTLATTGERTVPLQGTGAELALADQFETDILTEGALLFLDRSYTLSFAPDWLRGQKFLRTRITGGYLITVTQGGILTAITADPDYPESSAYTQSALLESLGFIWIKAPDNFQLFGTSPGDISRTYQKQVNTGDTLLFPKWVVLAGLTDAIGPEPPFDTLEGRGELIYNGIELSTNWPPASVDTTDWSPMSVPYLENPPALIHIDIGRQLFVDDFLIESTTLERVFGTPEKYSGNPVLSPQSALELNGINNDAAVPKSGGLWWDPHEEIFKLWYEAGWINTICYATSSNGLDWVRPDLDIVLGTNQVLPPDLTPDSWTVVPDWETGDPLQRYKMYMHPPGSGGAICMTSADGLYWLNRVTATPSGDRSTMFYNPFRRKWIYSLRSGWRGRSRDYREASNFLRGAQWESSEAVRWLAVDENDPVDPVLQNTPQLYNFDAVAYESIMLGAFEIHHGPPNQECAQAGLPKITELMFAYSRDGFHWSRPDRRPYIRAERWGSGTWDTGYVQSLGNICTIQDDKLWFYYSAFQGDTNRLSSNWLQNGMYDKGATGVAFLRRDGFAAMTADSVGGELLTRPLLFSGSYLFVNVECPQGLLKVEILDAANGQSIPGYTLADCLPVSADSTLREVLWQSKSALNELRGKAVRFRFTLSNGALYAFWVSRDESGRSDGYVAGGGPGYTGMRDTVGRKKSEE